MSTVYQDWVKPKSNTNSNHAALSSKSKGWLDQTCLSTDGCFSELALWTSIFFNLAIHKYCLLLLR
jgi:hypothetical protein